MQGDTNDLVFEPAYFSDANPATALDMVQRVPGFTIDGGDAVRGYAGGAGNVLIDGARPSTKNITLTAVLQAIPASQVERIELIRGERPGIDRQGAQLLVNVVRKQEQSATRSYTLSGYAYPDGIVRPSLRFETSRRTGSGGWEGSLLLSTNQDESGTGTRLRRDAQGQEIERADIAIDSPIKGGEARLAGDFPFAGGTLRGNGSLTYQDYRTRERLSFATGPFGGTEARIDDRIETVSGELGAEWTRQFGKALTTKVLLLGTRKDTAIRSASDEGGVTSDFASDSLADERILRIAFDRPSDDGLGWEAGGEIAYNSLGSRAGLTLDGLPFALPNSNVIVTEWRGDLFGRIKWQLTPAFQAEGTIRAEQSALRQRDRSNGESYGRDFTYVKPKLALQWDIGARDQLRLRAEREVSQLDFSDFASTASLIEGTIDAGNADLKPETAWILEAAWERRFIRDGAVTMTLRHDRIDNVLDRVAIGTLDAPGNIGRGTVNAAALGLSWPLDSLGLQGGRVNFDGEWRHSTVRDPITGNKRSITAKAPFAGEFHATLDRPELKSTFTLDVYFGQELTYSRIDEVRRTSAQPYVSLKWTYRPNTRLTLEASAENILSRRRERDRSLYDGPRNSGDLLFEESRSFRSRPGLFLSLRYQ
ncbi:TonB-dependent receptor [Citromicrobium bathyomarinum]|uniref:TonB-dependent receptor plug domain-containing protein n=1 Tax=Citromicrobium bathyomarinum TaxID=72174 RepID=UPI00315AF92B